MSLAASQAGAALSRGVIGHFIRNAGLTLAAAVAATAIARGVEPKPSGYRPPFGAWTRLNRAEPILEPQRSGIEVGGVFNPAVVEHGGRFVMLYRAQDGAKVGTDRMFRFCREHGIPLLAVVNGVDKYDLRVNVSGGGPQGQAGAVRHGIARALLKVDAALRPALKAQGLLTRDPRMRERKKYGQPGARQKFQYSKR